MAKYRSLIGGAHGDVGFEPGDLIDVPDIKVAAWLDAGLIEAAPKPARRLAVVNVADSDSAEGGDE